MSRPLKRATGRCGRGPMRVPHGWRRGWEKSPLLAATHTRSPASDILIRKCPGRERWMNFSPGCAPVADESTARTGAVGNSPRTFSASSDHFSGTNRGRWRCRRLRSEEHTSELQSHHDLVCRLLLEKKKD